MYNTKKYRLYTIFLFILLIIILLLLSLNIWNAYLRGELINNKGLLLLYIIGILIICIIKFIISYRLSDTAKIDQNIKKIVAKEKAKLVAEYKKQEIKEEARTENEKDINKIVKKITQNTQNLKNVKSFTEKLITNISAELEIVQALFYIKAKKSNQFTVAGEYAYTGEEKPKGFKLGNTLPGQAAKDKDIIVVEDIPDDYLATESGLGKSLPKNIILVPIISKNISVAVLELATFKKIDDSGQKILKELSITLGDKIDKFVN